VEHNSCSSRRDLYAYMYIVAKNKSCLYECWKQVENQPYLLQTRCIYCVYPAISKSLKQTAKFYEKSRNKCWSCIVFMSALVLLPFLTLALHKSNTRKSTLWSLTVYTVNMQDTQLQKYIAMFYCNS
jgi:hypothetical protein